MAKTGGRFVDERSWKHGRQMFDRVLGHWTVQVAALCSIVLLGILSLMPKVARTTLETGFPGYLEHGAAYLFTGALVQLAFPRANRWVILLSLVGYAAMLEALQTFVPGRAPKLIDFAFSGAGAILGTMAARRACC
jgi:hypothetical protein